MLKASEGLQMSWIIRVIACNDCATRTEAKSRSLHRQQAMVQSQLFANR